MPGIGRFVFSLNKSFYTWLAQFHITVKRPHNSEWSVYVYTYMHTCSRTFMYICTYIYVGTAVHWRQIKLLHMNKLIQIK